VSKFCDQFNSLSFLGCEQFFADASSKIITMADPVLSQPAMERKWFVLLRPAHIFPHSQFTTYWRTFQGTYIKRIMYYECCTSALPNTKILVTKTILTHRFVNDHFCFYRPHSKTQKRCGPASKHRIFVVHCFLFFDRPLDLSLLSTAQLSQQSAIVTIAPQITPFFMMCNEASHKKAMQLRCIHIQRQR
jgi:hypothetical protein